MRKILFMLVLFSICHVSYASRYLQSVEANVAIYEHNKNNYFQVMFKSNDLLDRHHKSNKVQSGNSFAHHEYKKGPKHIKIEVGMTNHNRFALIILKDSCYFLNRRSNTWFKSEYMETNKSISQWIFTLKEAPPLADFKDVYMMSCSLYAD